MYQKPDPTDPTILEPCQRAWILDVDEVTDAAFMIDQDGNPITVNNDGDENAFFFRVVRSGYRNLQNASMASVATLADPLDAVSLGPAYRNFGCLSHGF